jgi:NAD(P)H-dependent FMN reductase
MKTIYIILGSIREGRAGIKVANWVNGLAQEYVRANNLTDVQFELVDLIDWPLPMFALASPKRGNYTNPDQIKWSEKISKADGFIIVTPEYNHGYSSVLKNALDFLYNEWNFKPVSFVGYGGMGGVRAVQQLKEVAIELKMMPTFGEVDIYKVWDALDENGVPKPLYIDGDINIMFKELIERTPNRA